MKSPSKELVYRAMKPGIWNWLNNLCHTLVFSGDKLLLGSVSSPSALGYYNRSFNFSPISFMALGAFSMGPAITSIRKMETISEKLCFFWRRGLLLILPGLIAGVIWLTWANEIVVFIFGENWLGAVPYFEAFAFLGAIQSIYYLANALLQGSRLYKLQTLLKIGVIFVVAILCVTLSLNGVLIAYLLQGFMLVMSSLIVIALIYMGRAEEKRA